MLGIDCEAIAFFVCKALTVNPACGLVLVALFLAKCRDYAMKSISHYVNFKYFLHYCILFMSFDGVIGFSQSHTTSWTEFVTAINLNMHVLN